MKHKIFAFVLGALLFGINFAADAQTKATIPRIGILQPGAPSDAFLDVFIQGLRNLGYI